MSRARALIAEAARARAAELLAAAGRLLAPRVRGKLCRAAVGLLLPAALRRRFCTAAARDLDAVLELTISPVGRPAPLRLELTVSDGRLSIMRARPTGRSGRQPVAGGTARQAKAGAELALDDLVLLATGATGWPALLAAGRLRLSGDPFLALRLPSLLRLPLEAVDGGNRSRVGGRGQPVPWPSSELGSEPANWTLSAKGRRRRTTTQ